MLQVKDRRLEGESNLRQVQLAELYILDVIDELCRKHKIRYFLVAGSLIGCMRHKGFIPWDDDLDIAMTANDYKRFVKIAANELPPNLFLHTPETVPGCFSMFAKVMDLSSLSIETSTDVSRPAGLFVDIFLYEQFPRYPKALRVALSRLMSYTWRQSRLHRVASHRSSLGVFRSAFAAMLLGFVHYALRKFMEFSAHILPSMWHCIPEAGGANAPKLEFEECHLYPLEYGSFEGREYPIPHDAEYVLKTNFGDWRQLPPESERHGHHSSIMLPVQTMGFWWTYPHASLSKEQVDAIKRIPRRLVQV